ncbi:uncharacterized protein LOC114270707 [Camellia sinensis]|uniref:uncharacterized protein LOC114270707 n=1 Tax=Camellia sinensis TaxID=4442 RepID=UPI001035A4CE|nr:uncharacterized protein LOC114270707 [Camellia sinensis]
MEAYIDDMVEKSKLAINHFIDLKEVFSILKNHKLRLNALKCAFGVGTWKFLGYMVTHRGIEANPDQIKAIQELEVPTKAKEPQKLAGMTAALNRLKREQRPVYNVSKTLLDAEIRYLPLEKLAFALLIASRKLQHYFQGHTINVLTEFPSDLSSAELISSAEQRNGRLNLLYIDGSSNNQGSGTGVVLMSPEGFIGEQALKLGWKASNNETEYEALLAGLRSVEHFSAKQLLVFSDSQLVVNQLTGIYETRDERIAMYANNAKDLLKSFDPYEWNESVGIEITMLMLWPASALQ